jgi:hypothetical protein
MFLTSAARIALVLTMTAGALAVGSGSVAGSEDDPLDVGKLRQEFWSNEARADLAYLNKTLTVKARVANVRKEKDGKRYFIEAAQPGYVKLIFADPKVVAPLNRGDMVIIRGKCRGLTDLGVLRASWVVFDDCVLVKVTTVK